ncbi:glutamate racemase [Rhizosphaericola mali]|uniref:Glutamate racemase n=1 Tax=Rhizosphaericola mali TaxID=2545455 RepID=A0A5P2G638_9BACT|nr:glutamate racemase [Rhizosphaericola mali]QES90757.1 glutamate racemase [Rhizosphaericola mali]
MEKKSPIGVFDSGYGGLTILRKLTSIMPSHDFLYLGDNARAPYGTRSFETIYKYTFQAVKWFFEQGCPLVVLACNTASAKALRTIQQNDLPTLGADKRVLGIVRPTSEVVGDYSNSKKIGILATKGTVKSESYKIEINKFFPDVEVFQEYCPMWVPLVENNEFDGAGADYFVKKGIDQLLKQDKNIDTILLACTHYPLLWEKIRKYTPIDVKLIAQGNLVAESLVKYLHRHNDINDKISKNGARTFFTTDDAQNFEEQANIFYGSSIEAQHVEMN